MILSTALLFRRAGWEEEASGIESAILAVLTSAKATRDLGDTLAFVQMGRVAMDNLPRDSKSA